MLEAGAMMRDTANDMLLQKCSETKLTLTKDQRLKDVTEKEQIIVTTIQPRQPISKKR